MNRSAAWWTGS